MEIVASQIKRGPIRPGVVLVSSHVQKVLKSMVTGVKIQQPKGEERYGSDGKD